MQKMLSIHWKIIFFCLMLQTVDLTKVYKRGTCTVKLHNRYFPECKLIWDRKSYLKDYTDEVCMHVPCCDEGELYDEYLGTFEQGIQTRWCHQGKVPQCPEEIQPMFYFYDPEGTEQFILYDQLETSVNQLQLDTSRELWFVVHGFGGKWPKSWTGAMKNALTSKGFNVILCRWTEGSKGSEYWQASSNTRIVAAMIARVAKSMKKANKLNLKSTTIIGFSLGAHIAGFAGSYLPGLHRVVGLDPAGPLFAHCGPSVRLNHTDAEFVLAVHCNGESITVGGCGSMEQMGHIDFYSNGGQVQAGCPAGFPQAAKDILHLNFSRIFHDLSCSHVRCPWLFINSVYSSEDEESCRFKSFRCNDTDKWMQGSCCFQCDSQLGCPVSLYEISNNTPFKGQYFFGSLADNSTAGGFCGNTFKITVYAGSMANGKLDVTLVGPSFSTDSVQVLDGSLMPGRSVGSVFVGPWQSDFPTKVRVKYDTLFIRSFNHFTIASVTVQRDDGVIFHSLSAATVESGETMSIGLSMA